VSASGAEERSSSLRGGAFRAMKNLTTRKPTFLHTFSNLLRHLFITEKDPSLVYWILAIITLIGLIMRLWKINEPVAYDEAYTFIYFATRPFQQILSDYSAPNNHILHTVLVSLSYKLLGPHTWIVRLPAFIAGTLCIPVAYFAGRRIFNANQSLAAASLVALTPWFISYSTNGRGYTLLTLFALLLLNFSGILIHQQSRSALIAYGITAALGFYTIPIFLYPMGGISLWVLATYFTEQNDRAKKIWTFLAVCAAAGILTFLLYSPVIFFGTGLGSIINNDIVEPRDWTFVENLGRRLVKTWSDWMLNIAPAIQYSLLGGFVLSTFFYRKVSKQKLPLQVVMVVAISVLLVLQRVAPFARVWLFLEIFYMLFAGAGLVWLLEELLHRSERYFSNSRYVPALVLVLVLVAFTSTYLRTRQESILADQNALPEQYAANFLASHLQNGDKILSVSPVDMRTAYYLFMNTVPYDVFYQRDHPTQFQNAIIVLRNNTKYNTPESVLDFFKLTTAFDSQTAQLIFEYGPLNVFSVPAK
jgi:4-amino-4-deoxy-L-arabinose transferase-like glycosyltransferase